MIDLKLPRNMEYLGKRTEYQLPKNKQEPLGIAIDKRTGEHYVILNKMGTMMSYSKYYK